MNVTYNQASNSLNSLYTHINEQQKTIEELKERITCLESDSHNEVSQAEFDDLKEEFDDLKEKLDIAEAGEEQEATLSARLLEENKKLKNMISATWPGLLH